MNAACIPVDAGHLLGYGITGACVLAFLFVTPALVAWLADGVPASLAFRPWLRPPAEKQERQRLDGPDVLDAWVYADDVPALQVAALDQARDLYGPAAELAVERAGRVSTATGSSDGKFCAHVYVRCLNFFPEEDQ